VLDVARDVELRQLFDAAPGEGGTDRWFCSVVAR
jgi:hypothetical protein